MNEIHAAGWADPRRLAGRCDAIRTGGGVTLELVVSQGAHQVSVGRGGKKPSPLALVTMEIRGEVAMPGLRGPAISIEMTVGQTKNLIHKLTLAAGASELWDAVATPPEGK